MVSSPGTRGGFRVRQVSHATYFFFAENELLVFWSVWEGGTSCPIHILRYLCVLELDPQKRRKLNLDPRASWMVKRSGIEVANCLTFTLAFL